MKPIIYSEYKEVLDIVNRNNTEQSYQDLMKKEDKVLETVNNVVKYYRDEDIKNGEFVYQNITTVIVRMMDVWKEIIEMIPLMVSGKKSVLSVISKGDRPIYLGISLIIFALILFFVECSIW